MQKINSALLEIDRKARARVPSIGVDTRQSALRICDFEEVNIPFTPEQAMAEAARCIECPEPAACTRSCPVHNDVPAAMWLISQGEFIEAAKVYRQTSSMPEICGRVCPHDKLCQSSCVQSKHGDPIQTGMLEAFVTDYQRRHGGVEVSVTKSNGHKVAVVGAGPSGLACAELLAAKGYQVTIFDAQPHPGGLLLYGIPNFKLDKNVVTERIEDILKMGIKFVGNTFIGKDKSIDDLFKQGFEAVFVGVGTWVDAKMDVPGEDLPGVYRGTEYLIRNNVCSDFFPLNMTEENVKGKKIVVIGGGDTAADCLRTAARMGAEEVICFYRRTENEMPGSAKDRKLAREEGAEFQFLTQPVKFIPDEEGKLAAIECVRMELGKPDDSGRRRPVPIEGSEFTVEADIACLALGYWPDSTIGETTPKLETHKWGLINADSETGATSREGVFAGGDVVTGPDLVVTAMAAGRRSAEAIHNYIQAQAK